MNRIAEHREARGLTQKHLADLVGVDAASISRYERGAVDPRFARATKIASALGVSLDDLYVHDGNAATPQPVRGEVAA